MTYLQAPPLKVVCLKSLIQRLLHHVLYNVYLYVNYWLKWLYTLNKEHKNWLLAIENVTFVNKNILDFITKSISCFIVCLTGGVSRRLATEYPEFTSACAEFIKNNKPLQLEEVAIIQ